jgi:hypothetical protein
MRISQRYTINAGQKERTNICDFVERSRNRAHHPFHLMRHAINIVVRKNTFRRLIPQSHTCKRNLGAHLSADSCTAVGMGKTRCECAWPSHNFRYSASIMTARTLAKAKEKPVVNAVAVDTELGNTIPETVEENKPVVDAATVNTEPANTVPETCAVGNDKPTFDAGTEDTGKPAPGEQSPVKGKSPASAKPSLIKNKSPPRKKKNYTVGKQRHGKPAPKITVIHFAEPFSFELYMYEKDRLSDGFTFNLVKYINNGPDGDAIFAKIDACNFTEVVNRRVPGTEDTVMKNGINNITRNLFIRYPTDGISTEKTRQEGLSALSEFFLDPRNTNWPPEMIAVEDITGTSTAAMDAYMLNDDIKARLVEDCELELLQKTFKTNYPDCADRCWAGRNVGEWAKGLGFE